MRKKGIQILLIAALLAVQCMTVSAGAVEEAGLGPETAKTEIQSVDSEEIADTAEITSGDYTYSVNDDGVTAAITGFVGEAAGDLVIPAVIDGYPVTVIGYEAFKNCSGFTGTLTIPDGVTEIGESAFDGCSGLTGNLVIPDTVTAIGNYAFNQCTGFTGGLKIGSNVASIGEAAFSMCSGFTGSLTIPDSVTELGLYAFLGCESFTGTLKLSANLEVIPLKAFDGCSGFTGELVIPDGIIEIDAWAFSNTKGFSSKLVIPDSVAEISSSAFENSSWLENFIIDDNNKYYTSVDGVLYSKDKTILVTYPNGKVAVDFIIPDTVTAIGNKAFYNCNGLMGNLVIPDHIITIGNMAFFNCQGLTSGLTIPDSVTEIGNSAFSGCDGLYGELVLSNSITEIKDYTFSDCPGLCGVLKIPDGVTRIGYAAFLNCKALFGCLMIPESVAAIESLAFCQCKNISAVGFEGDVPDEWGYDIFLNIDNLILYYPEGNTSGWNAPTWEGPDGSEYATAPATAFGDFFYIANDNDTAAILRYTGVESDVVIPSEIDGYTVTAIAERAFYKNSIASVEIPNSVDTIAAFAFADCGNLKRVVLPTGLTRLEYDTFSRCTNLKEINIPEKLEYIGIGAFFSCNQLPNITLPDTLVKIDSGAFIYCSSMTEFVMPDSVTEVSENVFWGAEKLASVKLSENITAIPNGLFYGCSSLESLEIPAGVTSIGSQAISNCASLKVIRFLGDVPENWDNGAIVNCAPGYWIDYPDGNTSGWTSPTWTAPDGLIYRTEPADEWTKGIEYVVLEEAAPDDLGDMYGSNYPASSVKWDWSDVTTGDLLKGTVVAGWNGSSHCWGSDSNAAKVFDGDASTYFDPFETSNNSWCGMILDQPYRLTEVRLQPREGWLDRMAGGAIQGSNTGFDWHNIVHITGVSKAPAGYNYGCFTPETNEAYTKFYSDYGVPNPDFSIYWTGSGAYRYYRYVNLEGKHGDIAEIELYGVPAAEYGDTDNDGTVSDTDIALLTRYFAGEDVTFDTDAADVNRDGKVTRADAMILARHMAGWEDYTLPYYSKTVTD